MNPATIIMHDLGVLIKNVRDSEKFDTEWLDILPKVSMPKEEFLQYYCGDYRDNLRMLMYVFEDIIKKVSKLTEKYYGSVNNLDAVLSSLIYVYDATKNEDAAKLLVQLNNKHSIQRFRIAQRLASTKYDEAYSEIKNGHKVSHFIWYIFPQMRGLGHSYMSDFYGISDGREAERYMSVPELRDNLIQITKAFIDCGKTIDEVFEHDAIKFRSCMDLFYSVSRNPIFMDALKKE